MPVLTPVTLQMFPDGLGSFRSAVPVTSVGLQGFQISSSRGSVGLSTGMSRAISGQSIISSQNVLGLNPSTSQSVNITGQSTTSSIGTPTRTVTDSVQLTPLAITSSRGTMTTSDIPDLPTISAARLNDTTVRYTFTGGAGATSWTVYYRTPSSSGSYTSQSITVGQSTYDVTVSSGGNCDLYLSATNDAGTVNSSVATGSAASVSWQLASGHYEPRESNMAIEHPRPDGETNSYAQHRWCYTGMAWNTRICVRDGSYPFYFEVDSTSAGKGMYIGAQLSTVGDHLEADATYARLHWDNPTAGTHTITVNVYDQEYQRGGNPSAVATITWTLVVDQNASKYVCIDPVNGNDTTGTGTIAAPFRTIQKIHNDSSSTTTYANRQIILRAGTTPLDGMATNGNNYALQASTNPVVFVGYPGETCTLSLYEGWFVGRGAGDIMFKNVTIRHASEFGTKLHFYATVTGASRVSFHDCDLTNYFAGSNTGSENPALIYTTTGGTTSRLTVEGCDLTGQLGAILTAYMLDGGTFQHNTIHNATLTETDPSNSHAALYLKDSTRNFTVRANDVWDAITGGIDGFVGCGGQNTGGFTYSAENILIEYNKINFTGQRSIENTFEYGSPATGVHIRRNSCAQDIHHGFSNTPSDYNVTRNAAVGGITNMPGGAVQTENLTGSGLFDSSMNLTGANRTNYLGIRGAEIA